jgi:hypothetical protein
MIMFLAMFAASLLFGSSPSPAESSGSGSGSAVRTVSASASVAAARPVTLKQAKVEPDWMVMVPGISVRGGVTHFSRVTPSVDRQGRPRICDRQTGRRGYFADVQAYRWNGDALGAQNYSERLAVAYWRDDQAGGRVVYDGVTFVNRTDSPVLVAGWCDYGE